MRDRIKTSVLAPSRRHVLLAPFRPMKRSHLSLARQVATINHGLLDQSTSLGYLWSFLHPLITLIVLYAFFRNRIGENIQHYAIYLLIGVVQFTHFSKSTAAAMRSLHRMRGLATNVIFPKDVLVYSSLVSNAPEFITSMVVTLIIAVVTGVPVSIALLALPLVIALQLLLVLWVSLFLSIGYAFVRDLDHIYEVVLRILFFATPIIYSVDILSPAIQRVVMFNPLAHLMEFARGIILEGVVPPAGAMLAFAGINVALCYIAVVVFRRAEPALIEHL